MTSEKDLLIVLDLTIQFQLAVETIDQFNGTHYNKMLLKNKMKEVHRMLENIVKRDYGIVYKNGSEDTLQILSEYENLIKSISCLNVPSKVILNQMINAWNLDEKTMTATVSRIYKKSLK